eukprot:TRINITY_DN27926_c0_g1_i1.p1 TRINITY_DN27926_c0_g1~~TRINITY_DN27926_c0_g1_i1.p1  ORF type:complete len:509 (+),score=142.40 TRINITY_DN27926_c0_g1_i1:102-1628(+)
MQAHRALLVSPGATASSAPSAAVVQAAAPAATAAAGLDAASVVVRVEAVALTSTDALLCGAASAARPPSQQQTARLLRELLGLSAKAAFVPGFFFCGEVLSLGSAVSGLSIGEPVLGITDVASGAADAATALAVDGSKPASPESPESADAAASRAAGTSAAVAARTGGCYREVVEVHFSKLLPMADLVSTGLRMPLVLAHVPAMVSALLCASSQLRLRGKESLLVVAPCLEAVTFLLQRLLLLGDSWCGPLYLVVEHGRAPTAAALREHPLLRPLLQADAAGSAPGRRKCAAFLDTVATLSLEEYSSDHMRQPGNGADANSTEAALRELLGTASSRQGATVLHGGGAGADVILALGVNLAPAAPPPPPAASAGEGSGEGAEDSSAAALLSDEVSKPPALLRALLGALALRGRLVTDCAELEMSPADGQHLWAKEATLSMLNPHSLLLSGARHGLLLHALTEVLARIQTMELPVVASSVASFRLFDEFRRALAEHEAPGQPPLSVLVAR